MAPRLSAPTRLANPRVLTVRIPPHRISAPLAQPSPVLPPAITTPQTPRRPSSTWLLSALSNLAPSSTAPQPPPPKTLRARRTLPYPPSQIYTLIADIDAYRHFLPHCAHSHVTRWAEPPPSTPGQGPATTTTITTTTRHPALADLTVGWGPFSQTYTSRVYCVPGSVVEAVSGSATTSIPRAALRVAGYTDEAAETGGQGKTMEGGIFESLVTRWTVTPTSPPGAGGNKVGEWTEVALSVTFQFANPALGLAVGQLADVKVDEMVEAFEGRARELYGRR